MGVRILDDGRTDRVLGVLVGGAIGDALGAAIEFDRIDDIRSLHGADGVTDFVPCYGQRVAITDDTQMTLFTLEGIVRASVRARAGDGDEVVAMCHRAYLRWLTTQGRAWPTAVPPGPDGWLVGIDALHDRRAPGTTCLSSLASGRVGTPSSPLNDSKGCGAVMRAAPVGIRWRDDDAFDLAVDVAALTHGHPTGHLTAGVFALAVSALLDDRPLAEALARADACLARRPGADETLDAIAWATARADRGLPTPEELDALNHRRSSGWIAEEALAIALACALAAEREAGGLGAADEDLVRATLLAAVNHSGDSDSTGSMVGNLLGAAIGAAGLPTSWRDRVELLDVMTELATDAVRELGDDPPRAADGGDDDDDGDDAGGGARGEVPGWWWARYPGA